jgi:4-alpha-glucanotransferase
VDEPRVLWKNRSAGMLLHPSSLPGRFGIGDFGPLAYAWVDALARARQKWWQILPLCPTAIGDSPYQSSSTFAGNTNLLSPEEMLHDGLIDQADLANVQFAEDHVDFQHVIPFKSFLLDKAWQNFKTGRAGGLRGAFDTFCKEQAIWLDDFALFRALKDVHGERPWQEWPLDVVRREAPALKKAGDKHADAVGRYRLGQFLCFRQWTNVKKYANEKGIRLIGDVPIFVASDSADVWAHPELFHLDDRRRATAVAGVPPDYFSATGQLWGNPLYNWAASKKSGHQWWIARLRATLQQVDLVRLDHFRGFEAYWEIPANSPTAQTGHWVKGPGAELFQVLEKALGRLPLVAEDLGLITPEVEALRDQLGFPGMRVLQFAFADNSSNPYLPHNYVRNTVVYTGTHDNDTTAGWYQALQPHDRDKLLRYAPALERDPAHELMRVAWSSIADYAIAPVQDLLQLGSEARMNLPGKLGGNWSWRMRRDQLATSALDWLADLTALYGR